MHVRVKGWLLRGKAALCSGDRCAEPCLMVVNLIENAKDFVVTRVTTLAKVQTSCRALQWRMRSSWKTGLTRHLLSTTATHKHTCKQCRAWFTTSQNPFAPKTNTALLPVKPQVGFCSGFIWKEKEMWNSNGFELSTCQTISPAGRSPHLSHCKCVNFYHLRLNPMPIDQDSMLQIISSTCLHLFLDALHQPSPWIPYLTPSSPHDIVCLPFLCATPLFCLITSELPIGAAQHC